MAGEQTSRITESGLAITAEHFEKIERIRLMK